MDDNKKDNLEITLEDLNELKEKLRSLKENIDKKTAEVITKMAPQTEDAKDNCDTPSVNEKSNISVSEPSPEEVFVIPVFGRPVMPSQICPVQIKGEWEDLITEIARSQSKSFALFAIDEKFDVSLKDIDGEPGIFFTDKNLVQFLKDWQAIKELLASGSQTQDNYEIWKTIRPSVTKVTHE